MNRVLESEEGRREYLAFPTSKSPGGGQKGRKDLLKGNGRRIDYMLHTEEGLYPDWKAVSLGTAPIALDNTEPPSGPQSPDCALKNEPLFCRTFRPWNPAQSPSLGPQDAIPCQPSTLQDTLWV